MDVSANASKGDFDEDAEMENDEKFSVKVEKEAEEPVKPTGGQEDDDDVIMLPQEEPVVTEILDESENLAEGLDKTVLNETSVTDDDVMIQEPKIETQLVPDDDDDDDQHSPRPSDTTSQNLIVKIKEEPKDDGYEDLVNEEDAFVEVTAIANDDIIQGESFKLLKS